MLNAMKCTNFPLTWHGIYDKMKLQKLVDNFIEGVSNNESMMLIFYDLMCDTMSRIYESIHTLFTAFWSQENIWNYVKYNAV